MMREIYRSILPSSKSDSPPLFLQNLLSIEDSPIVLNISYITYTIVYIIKMLKYVIHLIIRYIILRMKRVFHVPTLIPHSHYLSHQDRELDF